MAIKAKISVDNSELKQGMKDAEKTASNSMDKIAKGAESASGGFKGILGVLKNMGPWGRIAALAVAGIGAAIFGVISIVNKLANKMDDVAKKAKSVNMSVNGYQSLDFAASLSGVEMENVLKLITNIDYKISKAAEGSMEIVKAFAEIGVSWSELSKQSPEQRLMTVISALEQIKNVQERNSAMFKLFEKEDIKTLNKLTDADFSKNAAFAKMLGVNFDEENVKMAERYADNVELASRRIVTIAANLKATKDAMKFLSENAVKFSEIFSGKGDWKVIDALKETSFGIGDAVDILEERLKNTDPERLAKLKNEIYNDAVEEKTVKMGNKVFDQGLGGYRTIPISPYVAKKYVTQEDIVASRQKIMFREVAKDDPRFKLNDQRTWIQTRSFNDNSAADKEKIKSDLQMAAVTALIKKLDERQEKHLESIKSLDKELNIEKEIAEIEKMYGKVSPEKREAVALKLLELQKTINGEIIEKNKINLTAKEKEIEVQKALLKGDFERVEMLKSINALKEQGVNVNEDEFKNNDINKTNALKEIEKAKEELKEIEFARNTIDKNNARSERVRSLSVAILIKKNDVNNTPEQKEKLDDMLKRIVAIRKKLADENEKLQEKILAKPIVEKNLKEQELVVEKAKVISSEKENNKVNNNKNSLNLQGNFQEQSFSLQTQAMKIAGYTKEAALYEAMKNAEKIKGAKLNAREIFQVKKLSEIQFGLSTMQMNKNTFNGTITNSLAQRGGFSSSVVRDDTRSINQKIYENSKNQYNILQEINRNIQGIGVIQ